MKPKYKRLRYIILAIICLSVGVWLILKNLNENIVFFFSPAELMHKNVIDQTIRVGGLVKVGSIIKKDQSLEFTITDNKAELIIRFQGIPPNLFREKQGIVARGKLVDEIFIADELLAKHDENYMPKEITQSLKKSGTWRE